MALLLEALVRIFNLNEKIVIKLCPWRRDHVNKIGFRDNDHTIEKPAGVYRIVVLGDSFTEGQGVAFENIYPRVLEKKLNALHSSTHYETIVCAKSGRNAVQEVGMYHDQCRQFKPDLLIIGFVLNDTECSGKYNYIKLQYLRSQIFQKPASIIGKFLFAHSAMYKHIYCRIEYTRINKIAKNLDIFYQENNVCYQEFKNAYRSLKKMVNDDNTPVLIVIFTYFQHPLNNYPFIKIIHKVQLFSTELGFNSMDLLDVYKPYKESELKFCEWNAHPNAKAHALAADAILAYLKETYLN